MWPDPDSGPVHILMKQIINNSVVVLSKTKITGTVTTSKMSSIKVICSHLSSKKTDLVRSQDNLLISKGKE